MRVKTHKDDWRNKKWKVLIKVIYWMKIGRINKYLSIRIKLHFCDGQMKSLLKCVKWNLESGDAVMRCCSVSTQALWSWWLLLINLCTIVFAGVEDPWKREPGESGSDWTPEDFGDDSKKNRTDQKFKGDSRAVTVYNVEATYFKGLDGAALLRDPEGGEYTKNSKRKDGRIYWNCRTSRKTGCSRRALTHGFTLIKAFGEHNHQGSKSGPQSGKRKSRIRDPLKKCHAEPTLYNVKASFQPGLKGGLRLQDPDGHFYVRNSIRPNGTGYWVCSTHRNYGCKATAVTLGDMLEKTVGQHQHDREKVRGQSDNMMKKRERTPITD